MIDSCNVLKRPCVSFITDCGRFDFTIYNPTNTRIDYNLVRNTLRQYFCRIFATLAIKPDWDTNLKCSVFHLETNPLTLVDIFRAFDAFKHNGWTIYPYWESMRIYATIEQKNL